MSSLQKIMEITMGSVGFGGRHFLSSPEYRGLLSQQMQVVALLVPILGDISILSALTLGKNRLRKFIQLIRNTSLARLFNDVALVLKKTNCNWNKVGIFKFIKRPVKTKYYYSAIIHCVSQRRNYSINTHSIGPTS